MPELARFEGISIYMRFNDHHFPHFHAAYAEHDISIAITTLEVLKGRLPRTQMQKVMAWARSNQSALWKTWMETRPG